MKKFAFKTADFKDVFQERKKKVSIMVTAAASSGQHIVFLHSLV